MKVLVEYCASCGTFDKFKKIEKQVQKEIPDIEFEGMHSTSLGNLEVRIVDKEKTIVVWNRRKDGNKKSAVIAKLVEEQLKSLRNQSV